MQTIFPEGTQPSWKITKIPGDGGGGGGLENPHLDGKYPGGGGLKQKCFPFGVWIFTGTTQSM